jgi:predicted nucleotidyltransferase
MSQSTRDIIEIIEANRDVLRRYGVRRLGVFGSHARGTATEESDLDFVVEFERKTFDAYMGLKEFLERAFDRRVDLVLSGGIKPRLREIILKEAIYAEGF